jgi:hypothetical protein
MAHNEHTGITYVVAEAHGALERTGAEKITAFYVKRMRRASER